MTNEIINITEQEFVNVLKNLKSEGGQFVSIECEKPCDLRMFPTDDSVREKINPIYKIDSKTPSTLKTHFSVNFNFAQNYVNAMKKALHVDEYETKENTNVETIVPNLVKRYISTDNLCFVYMPNAYNFIEHTFNGNKCTEEETNIINRYKAIKNTNTIVEYRTISFKHIISASINHKKYIITH